MPSSALKLVPLFREASSHPDAYYKLREAYFDEKTLELSREEWDFLQGERETKIAADTLAAECFLYEKKGFPLNPSCGFYLLQPIARVYSPAQVLIGDCYRLGLGTEKNLIGAVGLYKEVATSGNAMANLELAKIYEDQVARDPANKTKWYEDAFGYLQAAAAKKLPEALYHLGRFHLLGLGTEVNLAEGQNLVLEAARLGNPQAIEAKKESDALKVKRNLRAGLGLNQLDLDKIETPDSNRTPMKANGTNHSE